MVQFAPSNRVLEDLFDIPVERIIAWGRVFLSVSALVTLYPAEETIRLEFYLASAYAVSALAWLFVILRRPVSGPPLYLVHGADILISSVLMWTTEGSTSPFFVFFTFTLLAATLRWSWRGALVTTGVLAIAFSWLYYATSPEPADLQAGQTDFTRTVIRTSFLFVCGAMLAYVGGYREKVRLRFAQLAAWPAQTAQDQNSLEVILKHIAQIMRAPRVLAIWDEADDPCRHIALLSEGVLRHSRERPGLFNDIVNPAFRDRTFVISPPPDGSDGRAGVLRSVDRDLRRSFLVRSAIAAPFRATSLSGRLFVLDRTRWSDEDLSLVDIIASRLAIAIEERRLQRKLGSSAALQERMRLGRDLHDGVLQGLAAASMHLKAVSGDLQADTQEAILSVRHILLDEAQRIRAFVDETRAHTEPTTGLVLLANALPERINRLRQQWDCSIDCLIEPSDLTISMSIMRELRHMIAEAISNAVRHGRASSIVIKVTRVEDRIQVTIEDNGNGFDNLSGSLATMGLSSGEAPRSLHARAKELGGVLYVSSTPTGAIITIEIPT